MRRTDGIARFALFVALSFAGCGGSSTRPQGAGGGAASGSGGIFGGASVIVEPVPNIGGEWALVGFEDPVAVQLGERDGVLGGMGCIDGLDDPSGPPSLYPCRPITGGTIVGSRGRFTFEVDATRRVQASRIAASSTSKRTFG